MTGEGGETIFGGLAKQSDNLTNCIYEIKT